MALAAALALTLGAAGCESDPPAATGTPGAGNASGGAGNGAGGGSAGTGGVGPGLECVGVKPPESAFAAPEPEPEEAPEATADVPGDVPTDALADIPDDTPADAPADVPEAPEDVPPGDACLEATCTGVALPQYALLDFQPQSCGFGARYGLENFGGTVTVAAMLAGW